MEKNEFQKNLEKKRAYAHFAMIFMGLLIPTLFSVFKKINLNWGLQLGIYAGLVAIILFFHLKSLSLENKLNEVRNDKK